MKIKDFLIISSILFATSCNIFSSQESQGEQNFQNQEINMQFVEGSQDIPLAKGLNKIEKDSLSFDSFAGNVISVSYKSKVSLEEIEDFYIQTLPQMGWKIVKHHRPTSIKAIDFERKNEKLEIEFVKESGKKMVKFYAELGV